MLLKSKLPNIGTTIFTVMSQLATECGAINLSQGFPDFPAPENLVDAVDRAMRAGMNQYAPMIGMPNLRAAIKKKLLRFYGCDVDEQTEITVASGATEALFCAISAVVGPGDEVILLDPSYDSYDPVVRLNGGIPRHIPLQLPSYAVEWQRLKDAVSPRTRMIVINSPHNPTGSALSQHDLQILADITRDTDIWILSDEVYEHICFDGLEHQSMLRNAELRERSFVVSSFGKSYHATGWKIGYCVAPPAATAEFRRIHQFNTFTTCTPMQIALAEVLADFSHLDELPYFYEKKRNLFRQLLAPSRFELLPCSGTYFQLAAYGEISDEPDEVFARRLTTQHGVAAIPISVFYQDRTDSHVVRFCFAKQDGTLADAAEKLCAI